MEGRPSIMKKILSNKLDLLDSYFAALKISTSPSRSEEKISSNILKINFIIQSTCYKFNFLLK